MAKFKAGDKIKILVDNPHGAPKALAGMGATIIDINDITRVLRYECGSNFYYLKYSDEGTLFSLVQQPVANPGLSHFAKFAPYDTVQVIYNFGVFKTSGIYTVMGSYQDTKAMSGVSVQISDDQSNTGTFCQSLLVFAPPKPLKQESCAVKNIVTTVATSSPHKCRCELRDLLMQGCKCNGV